MFGLLAMWLALIVVLLALAIGRPREGGALTVAYFFGLSLIHVPGAIIFIGTSTGSVDGDMTRLGFQMTIIGMGAFVVGAVVARMIERRRIGQIPILPKLGRGFARLGWQTIGIGIFAYFVLLPISTLVPSLTSVVAALATLLILGLWLALYGALVDGDQRRVLLTLGLLPTLPLATLVTGGFLGYGVYWVLSVVAFLFVISRTRKVFYVAAVPVAFLGLSLFVTYMGQRNEIREVVWYEQSSLLDRLDRVSRIVTEFQMFDLDNPSHLDAINGRLNQNLFVGIAITRHEGGLLDFAYGATVPWWALIPRAVWPDKPAVGGSGDVVSDFTGIHFAEGTSIGIGQVLEFYINFGTLGEVIGFFAFGFILAWLDHGIMRAFASGDGRGLLLRAMPGLTLLQPGGSLLEMLVAFVAAVIAAQLVLYFNLFRMPLAMRPDRLAA